MMAIGPRRRLCDGPSGTASRRLRTTAYGLRTTSQPLLERLRELGSLSRLFVLEIHERIGPLGLMRADRLGPLCERLRRIALVAEPEISVRSRRDDGRRQLLAVGDTERQAPRTQARVEILVEPRCVTEFERRGRA